MRKLTMDEVEFTLSCEPEQESIEGNCSAVDEEVDRETAEWIYDQLDNGNEWAWCQVEVVAHWKEWSGSSYLGCCSYRSEEEFCQPGGYHDDLKHEALERLNEQVERVAHTILTFLGVPQNMHDAPLGVQADWLRDQGKELEAEQLMEALA